MKASAQQTVDNHALGNIDTAVKGDKADIGSLGKLFRLSRIWAQLVG